MAELRERQTLMGVRLSLFIFWGLVIGYITVGSIADNPLRVSKTEQMRLIAVSPQGWSFFTRNPREAYHSVYKKQHSSWIKINFPNSSLENWFGIKRSSRVLTVELAYLLNQVDQEPWIPCKNTLELCLKNEKIESRSVINSSRSQMLCGDLVVSQTEPIPWAWSSSSEQINMPFEFIKMSVTCN